MPYRILTEWAQYFNRHPFGEFREDLRAAIIARTIAASHGKPKSGGEFKLKDFLPEAFIQSQNTQPLSDEERVRRAKNIAKMWGSEVKTVGD